MASSKERFDRRLAAIFEAEAGEHVQRMLAALAEIGEPAGGAPAAQPLAQLFRAVHSLKGAARAVGRGELETLCHAMESVLAGIQRGPLAWSAATGQVLLASAQALREGLATGGGLPDAAALVEQLEALSAQHGAPLPPAPYSAPFSAAVVPEAHPPPSPPSPVQEPARDVRVPVDRLNLLLEQVEALVALKLDAARNTREIDEVLASLEAGGALPRAAPAARLRGLRASAGRNQRQLAATADQLLAGLKQTLLVPVGSASPFIVAAVRELAQSQGKEVALRLQGETVEVDRRLLALLREPLLHLLRNAIGHGIEPAEARASAGKPRVGQLSVTVVPEGSGQVSITVADDGRGIDTARLATAARQHGIEPPEADDEPALLALVFGAGISTAEQVTEVAGRGVGLAIVRETVERLGGSVAVDSSPGQGTRFTLRLPLSLATFRAVEVHAAGRDFLLPTSQVERCLRFGAEAVRSAGGMQTLTVGEEHLPLFSLARVLGLPEGEPAPRMDGLVVHGGARRIALAVDRVQQEQEVLSKPVPPGLTTAPIVTGAAVLGSGRTAPILNLPEVVRCALGGAGRQRPAPMALARKPAVRSVLVVEDSITSRTLLRNILELAGYRVDVASDGQEGLRKLRGGGFDLVVSDIEMPGLDGFALTRAIREDPALARLPVVLVTSLSSPADRERGAEAGANAYIVKSSFDDSTLLQAVGELA